MEINWNKQSKNILRNAMKQRGITTNDLVEKLSLIGIHETKSSLDTKISRGKFSVAFLLQCLTAIDAYNEYEGHKIIDLGFGNENIKSIKFIDLFAGMGGFRLGFEKACEQLGLNTQCVFTSEIKPHAIKTLRANFKHNIFAGDITKVEAENIPDFDVLLAGFPCQPFSAGGKRLGFVDTRGTLFFHIERILTQKKPRAFILENVEGLVKHDLENKKDEIGRTLKTILFVLEEKLGYHVSFKVLDAVDFGLPQERKRIFIVGNLTEKVNLNNFEPNRRTLDSILEKDKNCLSTQFTRLLLKHYNKQSLHGKSLKDKRGGDNNIHSWDIGLKGGVSAKQKSLLNQLFKERRKKHWAAKIGIDWMDGMPLTYKQIATFFEDKGLKKMLDDLVQKGYLRFEHPKKKVSAVTPHGLKTFRAYDESKPKGYNIVTGKLSFEITKILDPKDFAPTIVATDASKLAVTDTDGLRKLTVTECLRLFGFDDDFLIPVNPTKAFDLFGNTVAVNVVEAVSSRLLSSGFIHAEAHEAIAQYAHGS